MRPKGKLFALFAVFAAIGLVTASGAFTTVAADRTAEVQVAGDSAALIALEPHSEANGDYAIQEGGELTIVLNSTDAGDTDGGGEGINQNATTRIDNIFNISNQGTQPVDVTIEATDEADNVNIGNRSSGATTPNIYFYKGDNPDASFNNGASYDGVESGQSNKSVGMFINSTNLDDGDAIELTVTINATSTTT